MYKIQQNTKLSYNVEYGTNRYMWLDYGGYFQDEHRMPVEGYKTLDEAKEGMLEIFDGLCDHYPSTAPEEIHALILKDYKIVEE